MNSYLELLDHVYRHGEPRADRTGVGTRACFGQTFHVDLRRGFPLLTTKAMNLRSIVAELLGFLRGYTSAAHFREAGTKIWDANANDPGKEGHPNAWLVNPNRDGEDDLGRIYGAQWRDWRAFDEPYTDSEILWTHKSVDQIKELLKGLAENPHGRRHLVSAWNPGELDRMALPPCHYAFQCYLSNKNELSMMVQMRSVDLFLGMPYNIASYAVLMNIIAIWLGGTCIPANLTIVCGDAHIYDTHINQVREQLGRTKRERPRLVFDETRLPNRTTQDFDQWLDSLDANSFTVVGYDPHPALKAPMAV